MQDGSSDGDDSCEEELQWIQYSMLSQHTSVCYGRSLGLRTSGRWRSALRATAGVAAIAAFVLAIFAGVCQIIWGREAQSHEWSEATVLLEEERAAISHRQTVRQLLEGPELADVMTDNLMSVGHTIFAPADREVVRESVAENVRELCEQIKRESPRSYMQMDQLRLTEDEKDSVLRVMVSLHDVRLQGLAAQLDVAVREAMSASLDRDAFMSFIAERLQPRLGQLQELREELFPRRANQEALALQSALRGRVQAFRQRLDNTRLMRSFDAWRAQASLSLARGTLPPPSTVQRRLSPTSGAMKAQIKEFFTEVQDKLGDVFERPKAGEFDPPSKSGDNPDGTFLVCVAQVLQMNPAEILMCTMQALTFCVDMMRSLL